jgi:hypothetical protein
VVEQPGGGVVEEVGVVDADDQGSAGRPLEDGLVQRGDGGVVGRVVHVAPVEQGGGRPERDRGGGAGGVEPHHLGGAAAGDGGEQLLGDAGLADPGAPLITMPAPSCSRASWAIANSSSRPTRGQAPGGIARMLLGARPKRLRTQQPQP